MKIQKTILMSALILVMLVSLTGCIIIPLTKYYHFDPEEVSSIDIYDLRESGTNESGFLETEVPIYTIGQDKKAEFLSDFSEVKFESAIVIVLAAVDPSFDYGNLVVRINFADGSYSLYSCAGYGETYDANNKWKCAHHYSCDIEDLVELANKYVPEDIFVWEQE